MSATAVHEEGRFRAADGLELWWQRWGPPPRDPAVPPRGVLINLHGLGDHSGLYPTVAEWFPAHGWPVWTYDQRGNGRSPGRRGHIGRWEELRGDLDAFVALVRAREPALAAGAPLALMGTSLGGLVALDWALERPGALAGVVALSPPLGAIGVPRWLLALAQLMSRIWPRFTRETHLDLARLATDPRVVETVLADPLFHRRATARLATETFRIARAVRARAGELRTPTLLLHGGADVMVAPDGTRALAERLRAAGADVTLVEVPDARHALLADTGWEGVLATIGTWLGARASPPALIS